jgi:hypothetical protein
MPIRKRSNNTKVLQTSASPIPQKDYSDLPKQSTFDDMGVPDEHRRTFMSAVARAGGLPKPKDMNHRDLLEMVRVPNEDDKVENFYRERIKSPLTAIRAFCVLCQGGQPSAASGCIGVSCPVWLFRTGKNPLYGKAKKVDG